MGAQTHLSRLALTPLLATLIACAASAQALSPKRVLLVYQGKGAIPGCVAFEQSLSDSLHGAIGPDLEFYREQLDSCRFPLSKQHKIAELRSQYADRRIDVLIFFGNTQDEVLPGVPVVQVSNLAFDQTPGAAPRKNFVYVSFNLDPRRTIDTARRLEPKARKVLLIAGMGDLEHLYLAQYHQQLSGEKDLDIEEIGNGSVPDLLNRVSQLPRETIVLPIGYSRDPAGNSYLPRDIVARLANASTAPVYALSDTYVGIGALGGYVCELGEIRRNCRRCRNTDPPR